MKGGKGILVQRNSKYRLMGMCDRVVCLESVSPSVWQAHPSRVSERQEMRLWRLAGDPERPVWYVKECELHPESHGKQQEDLKVGKWPDGLCFFSKYIWQQREG